MTQLSNAGGDASAGASRAGGLGLLAATWPADLRRELRTDHAGEAGAVMIYRGVLAVAQDATVRAFAQHHLETEARHLALIESVVPPSGRSRLLPLWRVAGWLTGALPACFGPRAVYATIEAVETFVDTHYAAQLVLIDELLPAADAHTRGSLTELRALLAACQQDELAHRDDARGRRGLAARPSAFAAAALAAWCWVVGAGSAGAVRVSRWV
ncbi:MAG: demethoxyubiquinone hydroxylase family protein [Rubrivivax sp.]